MIRSRSILLFLFISLTSFAQNFRTVGTGTTFFEKKTSANYYNIYAIRIDSTSLVLGDSVFRNYRGNKTPWWTINQCLVLLDTTWMGTKLARKPFGDEIFFNKNNDSIFLHPQAGLSSSWTLYKFSNGDYIEATVTSLSSQSILSLTDNVKAITLHAKNSSNINIANPINSKFFLLSQNYGFVRTFDLYNFPNDTTALNLTGKTNPAAGISNLKTAAIYSYNIGDRFDHYGYSRPGYPTNLTQFDEYRTRVVTGKTISLNNDTITFTYSENYARKLGTSIVSYHLNQAVTEVIIISQLDNWYRWLSAMPGELFQEPDSTQNLWNHNYTGFFHQPTKYNDRLQKDFVYDQLWYFDANAHCFYSASLSFGPCDQTHMDYGKDIGMTHEGYGNEICYSVDLVYYDIGTETWGTPLSWSIILGEKNIDAENFISVYPNPVKDEFTVEQAKPFSISATAFIDDEQGRLVKKINIPEGVSKISVLVSELSQGIYFVHIQTPEGNFVRKIVK